MSNESVLRQGVRTTFEVLGDLRTTVTYHSVVIGDYNPSTDSTTTTVTDTELKVQLVREKHSENDFLIPDKSSQRILVCGLDLIDAGIVPNEDDYFTINGEVWEAADFKPSPADALYTFFVRLP